MCSAARCKTCGKTTWRGCGQHIDQVKRSVPAGQWCNGKHTKAQLDAAASASGGGFWSKLMGR